MKSKIHRATITSVDLHYEGSLTVDQDLLDAANLVAYEEVQVVNVNTGDRFTTYVIPGPRGSGTLQLNGAAARLGHPGDIVIVISYGLFSEPEVQSFTPRVVSVGPGNRVVSVRGPDSLAPNGPGTDPLSARPAGGASRLP